MFVKHTHTHKYIYIYIYTYIQPLSHREQSFCGTKTFWCVILRKQSVFVLRIIRKA